MKKAIIFLILILANQLGVSQINHGNCQTEYRKDIKSFNHYGILSLPIAYRGKEEIINLQVGLIIPSGEDSESYSSYLGLVNNTSIQFKEDKVCTIYYSDGKSFTIYREKDDNNIKMNYSQLPGSIYLDLFRQDIHYIQFYFKYTVKSVVFKDSDRKLIENMSSCIEEFLPNFIENTGRFKDERDGTWYKWIRMKDGNKWMAENLRYNLTSSYCYDNNSQNCLKYGRLYTWKSAQKVCPNGWHLPSKTEWNDLIQQYGGEGEKAYNKLVPSKFEIQFSGFRYSDGTFVKIRQEGNYWSNDGVGVDYSYGFYFSKKDKSLEGGSGFDGNAFSCRCVKNKN
jgi:uncharacterized protein (TIGR02145 family)